MRLRPAHRRLLAGLLLDCDRRVPTDRLMDRLWPHSPPATARNTLQAHVSAVRRLLPGVIDSGTDHYRLHLGHHHFDVLAFTDLVSEAGHHLTRDQVPAAHDKASAALEMWRGDPFAELAGTEAALAERVRLTELRLSAATTLAEALRRMGRPGDVLADLEALTVEHPLNEALHGQLVLCLYETGRPADALRALTRVRRTLGEELGVFPGPDLQELEEKILVHHPELSPRLPKQRRTLLPDYRTSFVGREAELTGVSELVLGGHRLVVITGEPGIGKTRLAVEVARGMEDRFPSGVTLVRLVEATTRAEVTATIASAMGLADSVTDLNDLRRHLAERPTLLVLDNCEHVLEPIRAFVGDASAGALHILATSRVALGVPGEQVWRLAPLEVPNEDGSGLDCASVRMLIDRVSSVRTTPPGQWGDTADLASLCRSTGGIPLAVELAARWVPWVGLRETTGLALESAPGKAGSSTPHHRSLASAIDWSVDSLSEGDARALSAAAWFRGTFTLDAFWQVCLPEGSRAEAAAAIARLADASLVRVDADGGVRYGMLEPIREYLEKQLTAEAARTVSERHAYWFERRIAGIRAAGEAGEIHPTEMDEERGDLRTAMRHLLEFGRHEAVATIAVSLKWYWWARYLGAEAHRWLTEAMAGDLDIRTRMAALTAAGWAAYSTADYERAEAHYEQALVWARSEGDRVREGEALYGLARIHLPRRVRDGNSLLEEALAIFDEAGATREAAECRVWLGSRAASVGAVETAVARLEPAIEELEGHGARGWVSVGHRYLSFAAWYANDEVTSRHHVDQAESIARTAGDQRALCGAFIQRAMVEGRWGDSARAARAIIDALAPIPENSEIDQCLISFGAFPILIRTGRWRTAARLLAHLDRVYERYEWTPLEQRYLVAADFRRSIAAAAPTKTGQLPSSSAAMSAELVEELADIT